MPEPMSDERLDEIERLIQDGSSTPHAPALRASCPRCVALGLLAEIRRLRAEMADPRQWTRTADANRVLGEERAWAAAAVEVPEPQAERCPTCGELAQGTPRGFACSNAFHLPAAGDHESNDAPTPHPEDACHRCGAANFPWFVNSDIWNATIRGIGGEADPAPSYEDTGEIICPACFVEACVAAGLTGSWELLYRGPRVTPEFYRRMADHLEARNDRADAFHARAAGGATEEETP